MKITSFRSVLFLLVAGAFVMGEAFSAQPRLKVMLLTGQSNQYHDWTKSSPIIKSHLEAAGIFDVTVVHAPTTGVESSDFNPKFSDYAVVVMDYETRDWPAATKQAFDAYMKNGGGLVTVHAADNAFPFWAEFNEMIGIGGWGMTPDGKVNARSDSVGLRLKWRDGKAATDNVAIKAGSHPPPHDYVVTTRAPDHPIMKGLPAAWLHPMDEIYSNLRGPAKNVTILATAVPDPARFPGATGENEPLLMAITYGKGRVFHSTLGHVSPSSQPPFRDLQCVGFITTLQRGTEWAATGKVTQKIPANFPTAQQISLVAP
jgi:type 1 glutamine amidotransferase